MDQSNAAIPLTDFEIRMASLRFAMTNQAHPQGEPLDTTQDARDFYLFLIGRDPVIDGQEAIEEEEDPDPVEPDETKREIISFRDFLRRHNRDVKLGGPLDETY